MEAIFHEKQEGSLCAQHCLNSLLQGPYFTAVDLSALAFQLDEAERQRMAEGGISTDEYCHFLQQPSGNMDDSGYFSVQVISRALEVWGLEMIPFNSREFQDSRNSIIQEKAFICNFKEHWLTVRKLGKQWFNLNSLLMGPELISDTYLSLFLTQLKQEGYSIFAVCGIFPDCEADQLLRLMPAMQVERPRLLGESSRTAALSGSPGMLDIQEESAEEREQVRHALELSEQQVRDEEEAADLRRAIQLSMQDRRKKTTVPETGNLDGDEMCTRSESKRPKDSEPETTVPCDGEVPMPSESQALEDEGEISQPPEPEVCTQTTHENS
uniref:ataxin-3-like isoform X3 n=1 Tax=Myxine glutinosa TaxID=7769 RepID=UPI00358EC16A